MDINTITPSTIWNIFEQLDFLGFSCQETCAMAFLSDDVDIWDYEGISEDSELTLKAWKEQIVSKYKIKQV